LDGSAPLRLAIARVVDGYEESFVERC
jgi:hypothetical protein